MSIPFRLQTWLGSLLLILFILTSLQPAYSQDTVSTEDVEFTPITDSVPAAVDTLTKDPAVVIPAVVKNAGA